MKEMTAAQQKAKELLYQPSYDGGQEPATRQAAAAFAEGYKDFLTRCKTEREAAAYTEKALQDAGYQPFDDRKQYAAGEKVYWIYQGKTVLCATIGSRSMEDGFHMVIAHIDAPRLDIRPNPLYEAAHFSLLKTHYYGGIRKYQWATMPLAIHGVLVRADGRTVNVQVGEDAGDPVFCITDLLPHLSADQDKRELAKGITGEELNVLIGSDAIEDEEVKEKVKLQTMILLNEKYGITEKDFTRAELEVVPASAARDVGFDRSMVGGYGQDDRVDAYACLMAEMAMKDPAFTTVCVLTDKEEIGSYGITGMGSTYTFDFLRQLCRSQGADTIRAFQNSLCLSADVTAAYDPTWASAFEPQNGTYAGRGVAFFKYTGSRGKSESNDASAEQMGYLTRMMDDAGVAWQVGELGKVDQGGGGTVATLVAQQGIAVVDIGVPVLSMHSPFEVTSKTDLYMAYRAFKTFLGAKD